MRVALLCALLAGCSPALTTRPAPPEMNTSPASLSVAVDLIQVSERVSAREKQVGFDRLTIPEQYFLAIWTLEADVNNGGFDQYFFNSSGDYARVAPGALRTIGAQRAAAIVEQATHVFGTDGPPKKRADRQQALAALSAEAKSPLGEAEEEFLAYPDDIPALLKGYVAANRSSFE